MMRRVIDIGSSLMRPCWLIERCRTGSTNRFNYFSSSVLTISKTYGPSELATGAVS